MKTSRIKIRNLFGITELDLTGKSIELTGKKGTGKTSVLDAIRYALTNKSDRDYIIHQGAEEGEILIETDTGLSIERKTRTTKADAVKVKDGNLLQTRPAEFLNNIFTPLQLNPIEFTQMSRQEKNRVILNLIDFDWNIEWIRQKFGEIPAGVNYDQHILQVLADIQAENGTYYSSRQDINSRKLYQRKAVEEIAGTIPNGYQFERWNQYDTGAKYTELEKNRRQNNLIEKAKLFADQYSNKLRSIEADREINKSAAEKTIQGERESIKSTIERLKAEIKAAEDRLTTLDAKLQDKTAVIEADFTAAKAKLDADNAQALEWVDKQKIPTDALEAEINEAEAMKKHLNEYQRMVRMQKEIELMQVESDELTRKIELARDLPGEILKTAKIPVDGLTVKDGIPLINGLPISNLSDGEVLTLCVDVTIQKPGGLQIILIDGAERLDTASRDELYQKCKERGLQIIASRTTDSDELEVTDLNG
jgi:predicted ATP-dependent endonuclease of OLD family